MKRCGVAGHSPGCVRDERSVGCWSGSLAVYIVQTTWPATVQGEQVPTFAALMRDDILA